MIAIVDYGMGNLRSVQKALEFVGKKAIVTSDSREMEKASQIILPGVGAARDAILQLKQRQLWQPVLDAATSGKPFLGICLGMQLLFEKSMENGIHACLGLIPGEVVPFEKENLPVPQIGWNALENIKENPLFSKKEKAPCVYFVHSYHAQGVPKEYVIAETEYGSYYPSAVQKENLFGLQFHPEKSGEVGLAMLKKFGGLA